MTKTTKTISSNLGFPLIHKHHPRSRSIRLKLEPDGTVVAVTPKHTPHRTVIKFATQHKDWIQQSRAKLKKKKQTIESDTSILIFGKKYTKQLITTEKKRQPAMISGNNFLVPTRKQDKEEKSQIIRHKVKQFLKQTASRYITTQTLRLAQDMKITYRGLTLREQKTRWGSCSSKGQLNFNWRLVHAPPKVIDYVIIHELSHLTHMDHSQAFWKRVSQFCPEYKSHKTWLSRHGVSVG